MNIPVNETLLIAFVAWFVAQTLKVVGGLIREKHLDMSFFIRSGGMPSSHTALVTSLATSVGILMGFNSVEFAIAVVFASIVMYDAAGVRRSVSKQSVILNRILQELRERRPKFCAFGGLFQNGGAGIDDNRLARAAPNREVHGRRTRCARTYRAHTFPGVQWCDIGHRNGGHLVVVERGT